MTKEYVSKQTNCTNVDLLSLSHFRRQASQQTSERTDVEWMPSTSRRPSLSTNISSTKPVKFQFWHYPPYQAIYSAPGISWQTYADCWIKISFRLYDLPNAQPKSVKQSIYLLIISFKKLTVVYDEQNIVSVKQAQHKCKILRQCTHRYM